MTMAMLLQEVRALVAAGWLQGALERREPGEPPAYCLVGAVKEAAAGRARGRFAPPAPAGAVLRALEILFAGVPAPAPSAEGVGTRLAAYNDDPRTTPAAILALVDRALTTVTK